MNSGIGFGKTILFGEHFSRHAGWRALHCCFATGLNQGEIK
ncbi:MAG: hypothetical protein ABIA76_00230 [Candidatus Diapherotrites archaeon]